MSVGRAILQHLVIPRTDVSPDINVQTGASITVYEADGVTLYQDVMYRDASGITTLSNPLTSDNNGYITAYSLREGRVMLSVAGATPIPGHFLPDPASTGNDSINVAVFGVDPLNSPSTNRAAFQSAIDTMVGRGGGEIYAPRGTVHINAALTFNMGGPNVAVHFRGAGRRFTNIVQDNASADILVTGALGAENCDMIHFSDFSLSGGRYQLRLNNTLQGVFERIEFSGGATNCIRMEGVNESHIFRDLQVSGSTSYGIVGGQLNGGTGAPAMDLPYVQKCTFEHVRVSFCSDTGILITAGSLSGQQSSGLNRFRDILCEFNAKGDVEIGHSFSTTFDALSNEFGSKAATNTYSAIKLDNNAGDVLFIEPDIRGLGSGGTGHTYKYCLEVVQGLPTVIGGRFGNFGAAGTRDILIATGQSIRMYGTAVTDTSSPSYANAAAHNQSTVIGQHDGSGGILEPHADARGNLNYSGSLINSAGATLVTFLTAVKSAWNPGTLANGNATTTTVTVTGAALGDTVLLAPSIALAGGTILKGEVTASNTVTVTWYNDSGVGQTPGAFDVRATVLRFS